MSSLFYRGLLSPAAGGGGGGGGTIWDDDFSVGSSIDTAGTRVPGARPWVTAQYLNATTPTYAVSGGNLVITPQVGVEAIAAADMGTLPAGDWTFETKLTSTGNSNFAGAGIMLRESSTGRMLLMAAFNDFGFKYQIRRFSNPGNWSGSYNGAAATLGATLWLEIGRSGSNITFRHSTDGSSWSTTVASVAQTVDFATAPDCVGVFAQQRVQVSGNDEVATFEYFHKTS